MRSILVPGALVALSFSQHATAQAVQLKVQNDSLSYGIGAQIGTSVRQDLHRSGLDSLNMELLFAGFRDGMDSSLQAPMAQLEASVRCYVTKQREVQMAKENAAAEANLKTGQEWLKENAKKPGITSTASGLQYKVVTMGTGAKPAATDQVEVNYRGNLINGFQFDSSYDRGQPITFGLDGVIPGWTEVLQLMPAGSKWQVYIPSELAYGPRAAGADIPANSVLIFDIELLKVFPQAGK